MSTQTKPRLTELEYLAIERKARTRSEFFHGEMFALAGASRRHNLIVTNIVRELSTRLRDRPCDIYANDMRVKVSPTGLYTYPDVVVACDKIRFEDDHEDTLLTPMILIEVLSRSTQGYDLFRKFSHYRQLSSLKEYLLVAQDHRRAEHYVRRSTRQWLLSEAAGAEDVVNLESIDITLPLEEIYRKVPVDEGMGPP